MKSIVSFCLFFFICACQSDPPVKPDILPPPAAPNSLSDTSSTKMPAVPGTTLTEQLLSEKFNQKKQRLEKIFDRLWVVYHSQYLFQKPKFELENTPGSPAAAYRPPKDGSPPMIIVGIAAYDALLRHLGAEDYTAALALMIGHELSHYVYYQSNPLNRNGLYIHNFLEHDSATYYSKTEAPEEESIADYGGAFNAWLARFDISPGLYRSMIDILYQEYAIKEDNSKYPPKGARQKTAENTERMLHELRELYRFAPLVSAAKDYEAAIAMYEILLKHYPAKEIYNNAGVNYLLAEVWEKRDYNYMLPIETDPESRLLHYDSSIASGSARENALRNLKKALELDPNYLSARLNLLCYYVFLNQAEAAQQQFDAIKNFTGNSLSNPDYAAASAAIALVKKDTVQLQILSTSADCPESVRLTAAHNLLVLQNPWHKNKDTAIPAAVVCEQGTYTAFNLTSGKDITFQTSESAFLVHHKHAKTTTVIQKVATATNALTLANVLKLPGAKLISFGGESW